MLLSSESFLMINTVLKKTRSKSEKAKANVVASVWGADFIQFLAILPQVIWKNRKNSIYILPNRP